MGKWTHRLSNINPDARTATCLKCGDVKIKRKGAKGGAIWRCMVAAIQWHGRRGPDKPYRIHLGSTCERCGFSPEDVCQLDIHHLDSDHENNDPKNLQTLCANCHRLVTKQDRQKEKAATS